MTATATDKWATEAAKHIERARQFYLNIVDAIGVERTADLLRARSEYAYRLLAWPPSSPPSSPVEPSVVPSPMQRLIERLFAEAPKLLDENGEPRTDQAPALECAVALTRGVEIQGALSKTPEGTFRMMSPARVPEGHPLHGRNVMLESFFGVEEVVSISLVREFSVEQPEAPRIIMAS